ncbi:MAG TPA: oxygen-independent coproporphyrinogen III oxidase [Pyrinomonadaceae bacterium]|nr:oxygen-independent coproporphyrinogen III oxidase [Pyrinomonadaceae bacterium]
MTDLFAKYDVPAPRYTSYPTVPFWSDSPGPVQWLDAIRTACDEEASSWSLYFHLPFCETLCTFCACNTVITRDHGREATYINLLHKEWQLYREQIPKLQQRPLRQLELGGGSPTFFSPDNLKRILEPIFADIQIDTDQFRASVEVDPRRTTREQLEALHALGFNRISLGVQDFDPVVQKLVNREQPLEQTRSVTDMARELGYNSVNYDLIYGLPRQTPESFRHTVEQTVELRPDCIAVYSFARVPWIKPAQRSYKDEDLPVAGEKRALYEIARNLLADAGYVEIGMDHFALPDDGLASAQRHGTLHRNFMGYTELRTQVLLGLGVSAISETPTCFHQNEKAFPVYERRVLQGEVPTLRGHLLSEDDRRLREQILTFMTRFEVNLEPEQSEDAKVFLDPLLRDHLVEVRDQKLILTDRGRPFLRNACMFFDRRLRQQEQRPKLFSQAL